MKISREALIITLIFLSALIIRLVFVIHSTNVPGSDDAVYDQLGLALSEGRGYVNNNGTPHSFYPPFYPLFLSAVYSVFGHSYLAVRILQSILGALTCVLIYLIGKKIQNKKIGIIAGVISIFYLPFIISAELLLTELVFTFLLCLIVYYIFKTSESRALKNYIILGILMGVSLLTKSVMLLFPLFIIPILYYSYKGNKVDIFKRYTVVIIFFALTILPWIARNYIVYHKLGIISTQGGLGLYSSYCPPKGIFGRVATIEDPVIREAGRISSPILYSDYLVKRTLEFIAHNPMQVLVLEFKKILYFWVPLDWEIVGNRWFNLAYTLLLPFFAAGLFLSGLKFRGWFPILAPIIYFQIMALVFYGSPRFRLPIEPFIFIFSAIGIIECLKWVQKRGHVIRN